ncbi:MAG: ATP-dependent helicase [Actinomycetales bacterium]|nr:ATP-dependent helicase [Actinomycetales bacterium]
MRVTAAQVSAAQIAAVIAPGTTPTPEQTAVIEAPDVPSLVVAGAGSGKTQTMSLRIVWLVANELAAPEEILGLTFTRKAAGELAERVRRQLRRWWAHEGTVVTAAAGPTVATYNSYAASVVADHALRIGHDPGARVLSEGSRWQLAHEVLAGFDFAQEAPSSAVSTLVGAVLSLSDSLAEHLLDPAEAGPRLAGLGEEFLGRELAPGKRSYPKDLSDVAASLRLRASLVDVVARYRERKAELGVMDFADQVMLAGRLARVGAVRAGERARFGRVILDEYQDTSVAQLDFLHSLFGAGHPVMAVGDPNQSIYGWRGASAGGLNAFRDTFRTRDGAPATQLHLSTAWRNDRAILDAANTIAAPLAADTGLDVPPLQPRPSAGEGAVLGEYFATVEDEADGVARYLARFGWADGEERARPTAAVLCRKRSQFGRLSAALRRHGIPFEVVGLGGLLSVPEVVDVVAALQAAHDPTRGDALMRLLTSARLRLGLADIAFLGDWGRHLAARRRAPGGTGTPEGPESPDGGLDAPELEADEVDERSIVEAIEDLPPVGSTWRDSRGHELSAAARERMSALAGQLAALRRATYLPVGHLVAEAERLLGLDIELSARGGAGARVHLDRLGEVAEQFTSELDSSAATLGAFLDYLDAIDEHERGGEPGQVDVATDRVQLLTVHAAKGLEWDVVVVPGLRDGSFPTMAVKETRGAQTKAWLTGAGALPFPLRRDYRDPDGSDRLPALEIAPGADTADVLEEIETFRRAVARHEVAEDRRVAYVALTRARTHMLLTGAWWSEAKQARGSSIFLDELAAAGRIGQADTEGAFSGAQPEGDNPLLASPVTGQWPADPFAGLEDSRRPALEAAAARVRGAIEAPAAGSTEDVDRLVELLLAEDARRRDPGPSEVPLPVAVSPTALTQLVHHRERFVRNLRRPVPREPSVAALRGTLFHQWIEQHYRQTSLVDVEDLPGADDAAHADETTAALQEAFEASEWAARTPVEIELDLVVPVGGVVVHARPDAIFAEPDGFVILDWKSGRPPATAEELRERELQLALYRLAWATYRGIDQSRVRAAFFFAATGETVEAHRTVIPEEVPTIVAGRHSGSASALQPAARR